MPLQKRDPDPETQQKAPQQINSASTCAPWEATAPIQKTYRNKKHTGKSLKAGQQQVLTQLQAHRTQCQPSCNNFAACQAEQAGTLSQPAKKSSLKGISHAAHAGQINLSFRSNNAAREGIPICIFHKQLHFVICSLAVTTPCLHAALTSVRQTFERSGLGNNRRKRGLKQP